MTESEISKLLPESVVSVLGEESCNAIQRAFEDAVEKRVNERIDVAIKGAEDNFDSVTTARVTELSNRIDEACKVGLQQVYKCLNERTEAMKTRLTKELVESKQALKRANAEIARLRGERKRGTEAMRTALTQLAEAKKQPKVNEKFVTEAKAAVLHVAAHFNEKLRNTEAQGVRALSALREHYENQVAAESYNFREKLVDKLSRYIDGAVSKAVPYRDIKEATRQRGAMALVESIKHILNVSEMSKMEAIKAPINEAKQIIARGQQEKKKLITERAKMLQEAAKRENNLRKQLLEAKHVIAAKDEEKSRLISKAKNQINEAKRIAYLSEKLASVPSKEQREYIKHAMAQQPIEFIKENFDRVLNQFRKNAAREDEALAERARAIRKSKQMTELSRARLVTMNQPARPLTESTEVDSVIDDILG